MTQRFAEVVVTYHAAIFADGITTSPECRLCVKTDSRRPMSFGCCAGLPTDTT